MANTYSTLTALFTAIAEAIRGKTGEAGAIKADAFPSAIAAIPQDGGSDLLVSVIDRTVSEINDASGMFSKIGNYAFASCGSLKSVYFPSVTSVLASAFRDCALLQSLSFPALTRINTYAFASCSNLKTASFPAVTSVGSSAFFACKNLSNASFPAAVSIGFAAFDACSSLGTLSFPSAASIGNYAFRSCYRLISLYLLGSSVCSLGGSGVFSSTPIGGYSATVGQYGSVYVPSSLYDAYVSADNWSIISSQIVSM